MAAARTFHMNKALVVAKLVCLICALQTTTIRIAAQSGVDRDLLAYLFGGAVIFLIMRALGEMSVHTPVSGAFSHYALRNWGPFPGFFSGWNYWFTYVVIWLLPVAGLRVGIRGRDRDLIDVSLALMLVTLITNKPYLGWARHSWDPIVLGLLLIGFAIAARRWLESGPGRERRGFTARRILDKDRTARSMLGMASAALPPQTAAHAEPAPPEFGGGRSGGAGGGDTY